MGAIRAFAPHAQDAVPKLIEVIRSNRSDYVRFSAMSTVAELSKSDETVDVLIETLGNPSETLRKFAALALGECCLGIARAKTALTEALSKERESARIPIAGAVILTGGDPEPALKVLKDALNEIESSLDLYWAINEVIKIGPAGKQLIPDLVKILNSEDAKHRDYCAKALGRIGKDAIVAVPDLKKVLNHKFASLRVASAAALWRITRDADSIKTLQSALTDRDEFAASSAAETLGEIGPDAITTVPALKAALHEGNFRVRHAVRSALPKITGKAFSEEDGKE
jgi:HEAT repeat protein